MFNGKSEIKKLMKKIISSLILGIVAQVTFAQNTIPAYYNGIDFTLNGTALKAVLATRIINTHTNELSYPDLWNALKIVDQNPENSSQVVLLYGWPGVTSGQNARVRSKNSNGGNNGDWNREHTYARSLGTPNLETNEANEDAHHVRATDVQKNNARGSIKFSSGSGNSGSSNGGWYPGDEWKGDVARMMMYMYLRYGTQCLPANVGNGSTANTPDGMIDLFLQWNADDPVSAVELQRNNYMNSNGTYAQGNRNPFIDNPFLATKIWGGPVADDTWSLLSTHRLEPLEFGLYPNPTDDQTIFVSTNEQVDQITIYSVDGRLVQEIKNPVFNGTEYRIDNLSSGFFMIQLKSETKQSTKKFIVK